MAPSPEQKDSSKEGVLQHRDQSALQRGGRDGHHAEDGERGKALQETN